MQTRNMIRHTVESALSPEGGISGKEGAEDDCDAKLMPKATRAIIWNALFDGKMAAEMAVYRAEQIQYLGDEYKASEIARTKEKVAAIEAAMVALNGCKGVLYERHIQKALAESMREKRTMLSRAGSSDSRQSVNHSRTR